MTGSLQIRREIYQMVFSFKDDTGNWRQRAESTGLAVKGNKRKAQEMLAQRLAEMEQQSTVALISKKILFLDFLESWIEDVVSHDVRPNTLSQYKIVFKRYISVYAPFAGVVAASIIASAIAIVLQRVRKKAVAQHTAQA